MKLKRISKVKIVKGIFSKATENDGASIFGKHEIKGMYHNCPAVIRIDIKSQKTRVFDDGLTKFNKV